MCYLIGSRALCYSRYASSAHSHRTCLCRTNTASCDTSLWEIHSSGLIRLTGNTDGGIPWLDIVPIPMLLANTWSNFASTHRSRNRLLGPHHLPTAGQFWRGFHVSNQCHPDIRRGCSDDHRLEHDIPAHQSIRCLRAQYKPCSPDRWGRQLSTPIAK
jgi:hypothetical protein